MSDITIKFRPFFREPMLNDIKVLTCRMEKMGEPGDTFQIFGATFELIAVVRLRLGYVGSDCFIQEGCTSVQHFMEVWTGIHPLKGFDPETRVWGHFFKRLVKEDV